MLPSLPTLPPLNLTAASSAKGGEFGGGAVPWNQGAWTVNTAPGGTAGLSANAVLIAAALAACLWLAARKK